MEQNQYVAYYRVSTKKQGYSGLGLEAQKLIVRDFVANRQGAIILAEYTEIETGRNDQRKILHTAIEHCKKIKATLIIAKLDRLARSVKFVFALRDSGISFVACDLPVFNTLALGIFSSFSQYEAETISSRIKEALAAKKARGGKLGSPQPMLESVREKGRRKKRENAKARLVKVYQWASTLRKMGMSYRKIAEEINSKEGLRSSHGHFFDGSGIRRMFLLFGSD